MVRQDLSTIHTAYEYAPGNLDRASANNWPITGDHVLDLTLQAESNVIPYVLPDHVFLNVLQPPTILNRPQ